MFSFSRFYSPNSNKPVRVKSFSTNGTSSITISSNGHQSSSDTENELSAAVAVECNELFEQLLQISVKYMMARGRKANFITPPKSFAKCRTRVSGATNMRLSLFDLIVYEICVRLCAQSLFFTNAEYYFNLALDILVNVVGERSVFNLRLKRPSSEQLDSGTQRANLLSHYKCIVEKQTIKNSDFVSIFVFA